MTMLSIAGLHALVRPKRVIRGAEAGIGAHLLAAFALLYGVFALGLIWLPG